MKKNTALNIAVLASLLSVAVQAYLASHYYDLKLGTASGHSFCNLSSYINCDAVTASKYATFLGVPMAIWGFFTNLILLFWLTIGRFNLSQDNDKTLRYATLLSCYSAAISIIMGTISIGYIGNICLFCVSAYVLSLINLAAVWTGARPEFHKLGADLKDVFFSQRWIAGSLIAVPAFAFLSHSMILDSHGFGDMAKIVAEKVAYWNVSPLQTFNDKGIVFQKGSEAPVMTIVEFADFRCPHCRDAYPALHAFAEAHQDVRLIFKTFPLDGTCNSAITGGDGISCALAFITECSEKLAKKGWEAHHFIYDNQEDFRSLPLDEAVNRICKQLGLGCDELKACAKNDETFKTIKAMASEGETAKIQGTPSIFVNSKLLTGGQLIPVLEGAYQKLKE